jgi:hypothetical protein
MSLARALKAIPAPTPAVRASATPPALATEADGMTSGQWHAFFRLYARMTAQQRLELIKFGRTLVEGAP